MKRFAVAALILATSARADETPNYHALDEMQEKANSYITTLQSQRNAALDQIVTLTAEIERLNKLQGKCGK